MEANDETTPPKPERPCCKNCDTKLSKQGNFCPGCGQRNFDGRVRMRDLLAKFLSSLTHLDNKFLKMSWQLLVPARVTIHYFQGKIKRYPHPLQFFFIVMFFFLLLFSKQFGAAKMESTGGNFNLRVSGDDSTQNQALEDRLREAGLFGVLEHHVEAKKYQAELDSLPEAWRTPELRLALDSLRRRVHGPWEDAARLILKLGNPDTSGLAQERDSITLSSGFFNVRIAVDDMVRLTPDQIIAQYGIKAWQEKVTVRQGIKSIKDPKVLIRQYVGSFGWAILVLITLMALVLRLLYWKRGGYYVEHFIFLLHQQSGAFLLLTLALAIQEYLFPLSIVWLLLILWIGVSLLLAMKRYYGEPWNWTVAKWLLYSAVYVLGLIGLFIATLLVVFVVF
jgi:hypothetical protein